MKNLVLTVVAILFGCLSFVSCGNEEAQFENIEFKTTGITLSKPSVTSYYAEIGSTGGVITITAVGKNASNGFLSQIKVGDYVYSVTDSDLKRTMPYTISDEKWGKVEFVSANPYSIRLSLNENKTNSSINYELNFGGAYKTSTILLTQLRSY